MYINFEGAVIEDLWSSKSLDLLWLSTCGHWYSPSLHRGPLGGWKWYWRVDVSVAAWATRTLTRAREAGARLPGDPEQSLRVIRSYVDELSPGVLVEVDRLALSPVLLGGDEMLGDASEFARFGFVPKAG